MTHKHIGKTQFHCNTESKVKTIWFPSGTLLKYEFYKKSLLIKSILYTVRQRKCYPTVNISTNDSTAWLCWLLHYVLNCWKLFVKNEISTGLSCARTPEGNQMVSTLVVSSVPKQNQNQWRWQVHLQWHPFSYQRYSSTHKTKHWFAKWNKFDIA